LTEAGPARPLEQISNGGKTMSKGKTPISNLLEELSEREKGLDDLIASANLELQRIDFETWLKDRQSTR